jgi:hypothetical protein
MVTPVGKIIITVRISIYCLLWKRLFLKYSPCRPYLIFTTTMPGKFYCSFFFIDEKTEALRSEVTFPRSHNVKEAQPGYKHNLDV